MIAMFSELIFRNQHVMKVVPVISRCKKQSICIWGFKILQSLNVLNNLWRLSFGCTVSWVKSYTDGFCCVILGKDLDNVG